MTGRPDTHGWEARFGYDPDLFGPDQVRVMLRRQVGEQTWETLRQADGRNAVLERYEPGTVATADGDTWGLVLPRGVAEAIADAVRPGPTAEVVLLLQQHLEVERGRVDRVLDDVVRTRREPGDRTRTRNTGGVVGGVTIEPGPGPGARR